MRYIGWALTIVAVALCVWWFDTFFERYEYEIESGYSREARVNPFLAAQYFLEQTGTKVITGTGKLDFSDLGTDDVVFLSDVDDMLLSDSQINKALKWIEQGGFLVAGVGKEIQGHASILERFDIDPIERSIDLAEDLGLYDEDGNPRTASEQLRELNRKIDEELAKADDESEASTETADDDGGDDDFDIFDLRDRRHRFDVTLSDERGSLALEVTDRILLNHPEAGEIYTDDDVYDYDSDAYDSENDYETDYDDGAVTTYQLNAHMRDDKGPKVLRFDYGQGAFTVLSSSDLWTNGEIGRADHAFFLAYLLPNDAPVHFYYNIEAPSLWALLKSNFWELLLPLTVLLSFWLWRSGLRIESVREVVTGQRRIFAEHLMASAKFLTAKKQFKMLIHPVDEDIHAQIRPFYPGFSTMTKVSQIELLAKQTDVPVESIRTWIGYTEKVADQDELIAALKLGNAIRNKL